MLFSRAFGTCTPKSLAAIQIAVFVNTNIGLVEEDRIPVLVIE